MCPGDSAAGGVNQFDEMDRRLVRDGIVGRDCDRDRHVLVEEEAAAAA